LLLRFEDFKYIEWDMLLLDDVLFVYFVMINLFIYFFCYDF